MSSVNSGSPAPDGSDSKHAQHQQQELFVSLVKQRDVSGVRAVLQSMDYEARSRLYETTCVEFHDVFTPWCKDVGALESPAQSLQHTALSDLDPALIWV